MREEQATHAGRRAAVRTAVLLAALVGTASAPAQRPALRVYGVADGLKYAQTFCVAADRDGMIWAGTSYGVSRYDGKGFASLTARDGLPHDSVVGLAVSGDGTVWAATQEGLARIAPAAGPLGEPLVVPLPPSLKVLGGRRPTALSASGRALWFSDGSNVVRLLDGKAFALPIPEAGEARTVRALLPSGDEDVDVLTTDALLRLSITAAPTSRTLPADLGEGIALQAAEDGLFVLGSRGLARFRGRLGPFERVASLPADAGPKGFALHEGGFVVATASRGLLVLPAGGSVEEIGPENGLPSATVHGVLVDRNGLLWLAAEGGLVKLFDLGLRSILSRPPQLGEMVLTAAPAGDGRLWVGHSDGLSVVDGPAVRRVEMGGGEPAAWALLPLGPGEVLAGTRRGLVHVSPRGVRRFPDLPLAGTGRVFDLARGPDGRVWASTLSGVVRFDWRNGGTADPAASTEVDGLPFGEARGISVGSTGEVFVGTDGTEVLRWDGARFERIGASSGLRSGTTRAVLARPEGLWVGTDRGVVVVSGGRARPHADVNAALDDPYVSALAEAGGDVWVASSYSVFRVSGGKVVERVDRSSGLAGASLSAEGCLAPLPDGRLAIGAVGGLSLLDLSRPRRPAPAPEVAIAGAISASGRALTAGRSIPFSEANLTFALRSPTFVAEERTLFSERLLPLESAFSPPHAEPRARYASLPPGRYTLEVRAISAAGVVSARLARSHFVVESPWWGTWFARLGLAAFLLAGLGVAVRLRTRSLRRRADELESRVEERTRELTETNRRLEEAQARITQLLESRSEAQLDPGSWAAAISAELALALGVPTVAVFAFEGSGVVTRLAGDGVAEPTYEEAEAAAPGAFLSPGEAALFPVRGASGELLGAVSVPEGAAWDESRRRLLAGFAHQLGGALEIRTVRRRLAEAESARETALAAMKSRGVVPAAVCPRCRRVLSEVARCPDDGSPLDASRLLPAVVRDRYRLLSVLGEGGMGTVFLAEDLRLPREVAIKIVRLDLIADPGIRLRFVREANTLARLSHPGVTALFDAGELDDGSLFLVMERLRGRDLGSVLASDGRGTPAQVAEVARQAGAALAAAHRAGVVHRDVKPENLVLTRDGGRIRVKVVDFGLAQAPEAGRALTRTGTVVGTPAFMAPEQVLDQELSAATDLYALSAVVWEALTGVRLVKAEAVGGIFHEILTAETAAPSLFRPGLPSEVDRLVLSALAKAPADRPPDADAWGSRLADSLAAVPPAEPGWREATSASQALGEGTPVTPADEDPGRTNPYVVA